MFIATAATVATAATANPQEVTTIPSSEVGAGNDYSVLSVMTAVIVCLVVAGAVALTVMVIIKRKERNLIRAAEDLEDEMDEP